MLAVAFVLSSDFVAVVAGVETAFVVLVTRVLRAVVEVLERAFEVEVGFEDVVLGATVDDTAVALLE